MAAALTLPADYGALYQIADYVARLLPAISIELRTLIELALHELCINIIEHAYRGEAGTITIRAQREEDLWIWTIEDHAPYTYTPPGIIQAPSPILLPERGWGLAIVHRAMDHVEYRRSADGNQWRLQKTLPVGAHTMNPSLQQPVLLVVDDEVITHRLIGYTLKPLGIDVIGAEDAASAFQQIEAHTIQLIFMDINLPGTDGFALIAQIRQIPHMADVPMIIITGRDHPDDNQRARELGASRFLYKPFSTGELRELVKDVLKL